MGLLGREPSSQPHSLITLFNMRYRVTAVAIFLLFAWVVFIYPRAGSTVNSASVEVEQQQRRTQTTRRLTPSSASQKPRLNYSKFSHSTKAHQQDCNSCHKFPSSNWKEARTGKAAFADITEYPEHPSCLKCHYEQFFARERPAPRICSVCHISITPRYTERKPFPNPPEIFNASKWTKDFVSDFRISFSHDTHVELVGENRAPNRLEEGFRFRRATFTQEKKAEQSDKSCAFCHQTYQPQGKLSDEFLTARPKGLADDAFWLKKGTFKTTPNHATCFTCHTPEGDMKPSSNECAACHKLASSDQLAHVDFDPKLAATIAITDGTILSKWRRRSSSGTFRHEGENHQDQSCVNCHKVSAMNTLDVKTLKVPVTACDVCHIGDSADEGVLNAEIEKRKANPSFRCTKCHITFGIEPIPESHLKALPKAKTK
jgi:hypothetical protein